MDDRLRFAFDDAALIVTAARKRYMVVGDLHIGIERRLADKGVRIHNAYDMMLKKLRSLGERFDTRRVIMLGDVKDAILYPDAVEADSIRAFFDGLRDYDVTVVRGNHDAHLEEIVSVNMTDELIMGGFAMLHGNKWPSQEAMMADYVITAHNHVAIRITDRNGASYTEKAWLVAGVDGKNAKLRYEKFNPAIKLIVAPAFNDLIMGRPMNEASGAMLNPLLNNRVFDYGQADVYTIKGDSLGKLKDLTAP